jgi:hypothetical protein
MAITQKNPLMNDIEIMNYVLQMMEAQHHALRFPNRIRRPNFLFSKLVRFLSKHLLQIAQRQMQRGDAATTQQQLQTIP